GLPVDAACGEQAALRPQRHLDITLLAGGADALLDQRAADAEPSGLLLAHQQAMLCTLVGALHQEHRADRLAAGLRDPAMLAGRIVSLDELRADLGDQRLVADVPAILLGIGDALARGHPAHVADAMAAQQEWCALVSRRLEPVLDRRHRPR